MRRLFSNLAAKAGVTKRVHAHGFRHTTRAAAVRGRGHRDHLEAAGAPVHHDDRVLPGPHLPMEVVEAIRGGAGRDERLRLLNKDQGPRWGGGPWSV